MPSTRPAARHASALPKDSSKKRSAPGANDASASTAGMTSAKLSQAWSDAAASTSRASCERVQRLKAVLDESAPAGREGS